MSAVFIAVMVAVASTVSPLLLAYLTGKQKSDQQAAEWRRQDEIHARDRAENAANHVKVEEKLEVIKKLVDGTLTATLRGEYDGAQREVILLKELGRPSAVIAKAEEKAVELHAVIEDRLRQEVEIEEQIERARDIGS